MRECVLCGRHHITEKNACPTCLLELKMAFWKEIQRDSEFKRDGE